MKLNEHLSFWDSPAFRKSRHAIKPPQKAKCIPAKGKKRRRTARKK